MGPVPCADDALTYPVCVIWMGHVFPGVYGSSAPNTTSVWYGPDRASTPRVKTVRGDAICKLSPEHKQPTDDAPRLSESCPVISRV